MPYKDPEKQRAAQRKLMKKLRQDPDYREEEKKKRQLYIEANKPWYNIGRGFRGRRDIPIAIRRSVYLRAQGRCEMRDSHICKGKLGIHHIDGNPENNELSNLLLLCNSYHVKDHGFGTKISGRPRVKAGA